MNDRLRISILVGCLLVIALHLEQGGRLLREVWRGPYTGVRTWSIDSTHAVAGEHGVSTDSISLRAAELDATPLVASSN